MAMQTVIYCLMLFAVFTSAIDIPDYLHVCKRNDPNFNDCLTETVNFLRPYLATGVPQYNIPSLEPLLLNNLVAIGGQGLKVGATNVKAYGASDYVVQKIDVDVPNLIFNTEINMRHLYVVGEYTVDGKVLILPISGNGNLYGNFTDCLAVGRFTGTAEPDASGVRQIRFQNLNLKVTVGKGSIYLDNLFGGDKVVGDLVNNAINSNFDAYAREVMPLIEKALAEAFINIANGIVSTFTYDQLFPM